MSFLSCLRHDLRWGLLRRRYLLVPPIFLIPGLVWRGLCVRLNIRGSWLGCMLYFFNGKEAENIPNFEMPVLWFLAMGGCLLLMLDYLPDDLTNSGQQVLFRCGSRQNWFLSKCLWNFLGCCLYFLLVGLTAWGLSRSLGGGFFGDMEQLVPVLSLGQVPRLSWVQGILAGVLCPLVTAWAVSTLQMTLCLAVKPVIAFLVSMSLLVLSDCIASPWILGNGAMSLRSGFLGGRIDPGKAGAAALLVTVLCVIMGTALFRKTDILGTEDE